MIGTAELDDSRLDAVLAAGVEAGAAAGVVAVVVDRDGVRYQGAAGEREHGSGQAMTVDTVGTLFSMTKAITATAAMQLVERGDLDLDAPGADFCPDLADRQVLVGFDDDGRPLLRPAASAPTVRHLLTHTSGFGYELFNPDLVRWHEATGTPGLAANGRELLGEPLVFDPGTRWEYGIGLDWVGALVEAVSGVSLGTYVAEHVTGPLGMTDTAYVVNPSMASRLSSMHARLPDGSMMPFALPLPEPGAHEGGGAGLFGTMGDYARFIRMILRNGELDGVRVLDADTVEQMASNQIGDLRVEPLTTAMPNLTNDAEYFPGEPKTWGLSFQINEHRAATGRQAGTLMWAGLANSIFWIDRVHGIGGAFMAQILPFADPAVTDLYLQFETAVYADASS